jgi:hypothetical protein
MQHPDIVFVDLRSDPSTRPEHVEELTSYGGHLHSLRQVAHLSLSVNLRSLCVHGNALRRIDGLGSCRSLTDLNLSSNFLERIEGLEQLHQLRFLNLASNRLTTVGGLDANLQLERLILSHNYISTLSGLQVFHDRRANLSVLDLRDNRIATLEEITMLAGIARLKDLRISGTNAMCNPVCCTLNFRAILAASIPQLKLLDQQVVRTEIFTVPVTAATATATATIPQLQQQLHQLHAFHQQAETIAAEHPSNRASNQAAVAASQAPMPASSFSTGESFSRILAENQNPGSFRSRPRPTIWHFCMYILHF